MPAGPPGCFLNCYLPRYWLFESSCFSRDYDAFLDDLEEDKTYRQNINIYVGKVDVRHVFSCLLLRKSFVLRGLTVAFRISDRDYKGASDDDDEETPKISLQEMLEDLHLDEPDSAAMLTE